MLSSLVVLAILVPICAVIYLKIIRRRAKKRKELQEKFATNHGEQIKTITDLFGDLKANMFSITENDDDDEVIYEYGVTKTPTTTSTVVVNPYFL